MMVPVDAPFFVPLDVNMFSSVWLLRFAIDNEWQPACWPTTCDDTLDLTRRADPRRHEAKFGPGAQLRSGDGGVVCETASHSRKPRDCRRSRV
jgi:hypothetical protein